MPSDSTCAGVDESRVDQSGFSPVRFKRFSDRVQTSPRSFWARTALDWTGMDQSTAVSRFRVHFSMYQSFNGRNIF